MARTCVCCLHRDNKGPYKSFDGFLSALKQSKRATIRKERKSVTKQGLKVRGAAYGPWV